MQKELAKSLAIGAIELGCKAVAAIGFVNLSARAFELRDEKENYEELKDIKDRSFEDVAVGSCIIAGCFLASAIKTVVKVIEAM